MRKAVLVAEDADGIRRLIRSIVEREQLDVVEARNGIEAIAQIRARRFDLAIVDLMMPGASGYRVLDTIKAEAPELRCIVVTAAGEVGIGVLDPNLTIVRKPFDPARLAEVIREAINGETTVEN